MVTVKNGDCENSFLNLCFYNNNQRIEKVNIKALGISRFIITIIRYGFLQYPVKKLNIEEDIVI